ncbi:SDR family NAD(P)-dependent oxidoreductase [Ruegeria hyattellae]|uniref:SDR family NAD(P)-dependent oxidoreductase n=1 Tax=Ruegeria hyattellae TaxID=3233337 RepID=UPI00355C9D86
MQKTILITGSTDGIGLEAAKRLASEGHRVLLHGRNPAKLDAAAAEVGGDTQRYVADLSRLSEVVALADAIADQHDRLDVLINNAGVLKTPQPVTEDGMDVRFVVNTLAPYVLARRLLPLMEGSGRIINLSSAAQAPVNLQALAGTARLADMEAYAQSKLAITMWSRELAGELTEGPVVVAVNPGSLLASKMVKEGFGVAGNDIGIGADILHRAALSDEFATATGTYFDNDSGRFGLPHADALDASKSAAVMQAIEAALAK